MNTRPNRLAAILALIWLAVVIAPVYAVVTTALHPAADFLTDGPLQPPTGLTLENVSTVLEGGFPTYLVNTLVVGAATVALVLVCALTVSYAIVRGEGFVASQTFRLFLLGLAIPAQAVIIPIYWIINELGLYDTLWAVVLPTAAFSLPVAVLVLSNGMRDVPGELYEAIAMDGASPARAFVTLTVPLSRGSVMTVVVFTALQAWNGFLFPLILTQSQDVRLLTVGLYDFVGQFSADKPALLAAVVMSVLPILFVYLVARRSLVAGLAGAGGK